MPSSKKSKIKKVNPAASKKIKKCPPLKRVRSNEELSLNDLALPSDFDTYSQLSSGDESWIVTDMELENNQFEDVATESDSPEGLFQEDGSIKSGEGKKTPERILKDDVEIVPLPPTCLSDEDETDEKKNKAIVPYKPYRLPAVTVSQNNEEATKLLVSKLRKLKLREQVLFEKVIFENGSRVPRSLLPHLPQTMLLPKVTKKALKQAKQRELLLAELQKQQEKNQNVALIPYVPLSMKERLHNLWYNKFIVPVRSVSFRPSSLKNTLRSVSFRPSSLKNTLPRMMKALPTIPGLSSSLRTLQQSSLSRSLSDCWYEVRTRGERLRKKLAEQLRRDISMISFTTLIFVILVFLTPLILDVALDARKNCIGPGAAFNSKCASPFIRLTQKDSTEKTKVLKKTRSRNQQVKLMEDFEDFDFTDNFSYVGENRVQVKVSELKNASVRTHQPSYNIDDDRLKVRMFSWNQLLQMNESQLEWDNRHQDLRKVWLNTAKFDETSGVYGQYHLQNLKKSVDRRQKQRQPSDDSRVVIQTTVKANAKKDSERKCKQATKTTTPMPKKQATKTTTPMPKKQATKTTTPIPKKQATKTTTPMPKKQATKTTTPMPKKQATKTTTPMPKKQATKTTTPMPKKQTTKTTTPMPKKQATKTTTPIPTTRTSRGPPPPTRDSKKYGPPTYVHLTNLKKDDILKDFPLTNLKKDDILKDFKLPPPPPRSDYRPRGSELNANEEYKRLRMKVDSLLGTMRNMLVNNKTQPILIQSEDKPRMTSHLPEWQKKYERMSMAIVRLRREVNYLGRKQKALQRHSHPKCPKVKFELKIVTDQLKFQKTQLFQIVIERSNLRLQMILTRPKSVHVSDYKKRNKQQRKVNQEQRERKHKKKMDEKVAKKVAEEIKKHKIVMYDNEGIRFNINADAHFRLNLKQLKNAKVTNDILENVLSEVRSQFEKKIGFMVQEHRNNSTNALARNDMGPYEDTLTERKKCRSRIENYLSASLFKKMEPSQRWVYEQNKKKEMDCSEKRKFSKKLLELVREHRGDRAAVNGYARRYLQFVGSEEECFPKFFTSPLHSSYRGSKRSTAYKESKVIDVSSKLMSLISMIKQELVNEWQYLKEDISFFIGKTREYSKWISQELFHRLGFQQKSKNNGIKIHLIKQQFKSIFHETMYQVWPQTKTDVMIRSPLYRCPREILKTWFDLANEASETLRNAIKVPLRNAIKVPFVKATPVANSVNAAKYTPFVPLKPILGTPLNIALSQTKPTMPVVKTVDTQQYPPFTPLKPILGAPEKIMPKCSDMKPNYTSPRLNVRCGAHEAKKCAFCPFNGSKFMGPHWCNGECKWDLESSNCIPN